MLAAIFDMDGVLLDSEPLHHAVLNAVLVREGKTLSFDDYRRDIGTTLEYTWADLIQRLQLSGSLHQYMADYDAAILESYHEHSVLAPGVLDLLELLARRGLRLAVASSSRTAWVEAALRALDIRDRFEQIVSGDMVQRGKPDPEIYLLAAARLGVPPERCLAVEDAPKGVLSARTAGMTVIGVRTDYTAHAPLAGAALVLDSLEQFTPKLLDDLLPRSHDLRAAEGDR